MTIQTNNTQKPLMIFSHFPKTGGTTLKSIIDQEYKNKKYYILANESLSINLHKLKEGLDNTNSIQIVEGYIGYGIHELLPRTCKYITMLRNPIDRMISRYWYLKGLDSESHRKAVFLAKNNSLEDFAQRIGDNSMTRFISGSDFNTLVGMGLENHSFITLQTAKIQGNIPNYEKSSVEMLEQAKKNLREHFTVIGLTEKFDESLILFNKKLGWENIYYTKRNVNKNKPIAYKEKISNSTLTCIEKYNELDIELYRYAQELFEEQINQYGDSFEQDLKVFQSTNPIYGKLNSLTNSVKTSFNQGVNSSKRFVKTLLPIPNQKR